MNEKFQLPCLACGALIEIEVTGRDSAVARHPRPLCEGAAQIVKERRILSLSLEILEDNDTKPMVS